MQLFAFGLFEISLQLRVPFQRKGTAASGLHGLLWWLKGWLSSTRAGWCAGECSRSQSSLFYGQVSSNPISWSSWSQAGLHFDIQLPVFLIQLNLCPSLKPLVHLLHPMALSKGGFATPKWLGQVLRPRCGLVFGTRMCLGNCFQVHKVQRIGYSKASIVNLLIEPWMSFSRWLVPERGHFHFSQPKRHMIFDLYWFMMIFLYQSPAPFDAWCFEFPSGAQPPTGLGPGWGRKSVTKRKVSSV